MTFMQTSLTFRQHCDTTRSTREQSRHEALGRLHIARSIFETMSGEQVTTFAASDAPVTAGTIDSDDKTHEPIEG